MYRAERDAILSDIYESFSMLKEGTPYEVGATAQTYAYWMCRLMDIHIFVVDKFGRGKYRNAYFGRQNTPGKRRRVWRGIDRDGSLHRCRLPPLLSRRR